jgi:PIN domain nuclease of toxin-antitoxin system
MKVLLDTHTWLWFVLGDSSLSPAARSLIEDPANEKIVSPASYWETAIKISIGKYTLPQAYDQFIRHAIAGQGFSVLPILPSHTSALISLPFHHRDPFDRLLVAQSLAEAIPLISNDTIFDAYLVKRLW